ncbi:NVEALA domain-containing protein [Bacteroides graminisolvens]|uniref:NVEALA domain-containing protein n=1 Tax=Bacteroides graminisolvens TaxID=477666 RepID=UPI0029C95836|nr:NVEALA domain-containing protein [Bacteroides graminisolvens]
MNAKLKLFCLIFVVCTLTYLCKKSKSVESELFMSNVEALASGEKSGDIIRCNGIGSLDCPQTKSKVYRIWYQ